jgi:glucose-6-phosphate-specific signal transduction histidine kinase
MILVIAAVVVVLVVAIALRERVHARRLRAVTDELQRERERTEELISAEERARVAREAYELERSGAATEQPGLGELPGLVERARAAGMPVTLSVEGNPPRQLPAVLDVSAFRIVQEALRNAHQHARGAPASVRVSWERRALCLQVRDVGVSERQRTSGPGHGIPAMRERAHLHGGELRTERLPGGGFEVTAVLPL